MPAELTDLLGNFNKLGSQQSREQSALLIQRSLSPENAKAMKGQVFSLFFHQTNTILPRF